MAPVNRTKGYLQRKQAAARKTDRPRRRVPEGHSGTVTAADLEGTDAVKELLVALNDAYVGAAKIQTLVDAIPCLRARCIQRAKGGDEELDMPLSRALARIGNMGLETELLLLLEDMTVLQADLQATADVG